MQVSSSPKLLNEFIESIGQAAGATTQLLHHHQDPRWMMVREALELTKEGATKVATFAATKFTNVRPA